MDWELHGVCDVPVGSLLSRCVCLSGLLSAEDPPVSRGPWARPRPKVLPVEKAGQEVSWGCGLGLGGSPSSISSLRPPHDCKKQTHHSRQRLAPAEVGASSLPGVKSHLPGTPESSRLCPSCRAASHCGVQPPPPRVLGSDFPTHVPASTPGPGQGRRALCRHLRSGPSRQLPAHCCQGTLPGGEPENQPWPVLLSS